MIDPNGNSNATSIPSAAAPRETFRVASSLVARSSAALKSASRAHPYLVAAGIIAVLGLAVTGGLLARSPRRRSLSHILTGWL
jgi:hypothetical protein